MKILVTGNTFKSPRTPVKIIDMLLEMCKVFEKRKKSDFIWSFINDVLERHGRIPKR